MTPRDPVDRRRLLALLVSTALGTTLRSARGGPLDQGIGGTGAAPPTEASDRGIGGTGVIGTIRKFGSIVVNDLRIAYPPDVLVRVDGVPASVSDLKIGQVVRVDAAGRSGALSTRVIDVTSEVVGPVERVGPHEVTVLGQTVSTADLTGVALKPGDVVAVSGLRRNDGTIVASLIQPRPGAVSRLAGPVTRGEGGAVRIGGLTVAGVDPALVGRRALVEVRTAGDRAIATRSLAEASLLPNARTLSIESYVERRNGRLSLGSGYAVGAAQRLDLPAGRSVRAVLTTRVDADGRLQVDGARLDARPGGGRGGHGGTPGGSPNGGSRRPTRGALPDGQRIPATFDRGPGDRGPGGPAGPDRPGGPFRGGGWGGGGLGGGPGGGGRGGRR